MTPSQTYCITVCSHMQKKILIGNYQCGFKERKSTTDHIHAFRQTLENARKHKISTYHLSAILKRHATL